MVPERTLIVISGPTGVGKTALAIELAQRLKTEIISADSRQFYKDLSIGVARPTQEQLLKARHHFIGFLPIDSHYTAGQFAREAEQKLSHLFQAHRYVVCVGGSGLFIDALVEGLDELPTSEKVREEIKAFYSKNGVEGLQQILKEKDPVSYSEIDLNNPHRLMRAIEVCMISDIPFSQLKKRKVAERSFSTITFVLNAPREWVYNQVNERVDEMIAQGLEEEARSMFASRNLNALNTVGYKELFDFFDGKITREEAIEKIKQHTRNYVKRQLTWWRRKDGVHWLSAEKGPLANTDTVLSVITDQQAQ